MLTPPPRRPTSTRSVDRRVLALRSRLAENPRDLEAQLRLARLALEAGDPQLARLQLGAALEQAGQHAPALNLMGLVSWQLGDHQQALDDFSKAREADAGLLAARLNLAALLVLYEDSDGARQALGPHLHSARLDLPDLHPSVRSALARLREPRPRQAR